MTSTRVPGRAGPFSARVAVGVSPAVIVTMCTGMIAGMIAGIMAAAPAAAQDVRGARVGVFLLKPSIDVEERYDSNIFETNTGETDSFITTVEPRINATTDLSRHRLSFDGGVQGEFFHQSSDDDNFTYDGRLDGTLDITRRLRFRAGGGYRRVVEQRGSDEVDFAIGGPIKSDIFFADARFQYLPGDFRIEPFVSFNRRDYMDRDGIDQDERDRNVSAAGLELGYQLRTGLELFVRGTYFDIDYDDALNNAGFDRDSDGYEVFGGVNLKLSRLLTGSLGAGFSHASFDDPQFQSTDDFTVRGGLFWNPRRGINVSFTASREVEQTNVAGASDKVSTDASLGVRYEILRVLDGIARVGFTERDFNGINRTDTGYFGQVGLEWRATRRATLRASYRYYEETSTNQVQEYDKHLVTVGVAYGF